MKSISTLLHPTPPPPYMKCRNKGDITIKEKDIILAIKGERLSV